MGSRRPHLLPPGVSDVGSLPRLCRHCRLLLIRSPHLGALMTQSVVLLLCWPQLQGHLQAHSMFTPEEAFFSRVGAMSFTSQGRQLPFPPLGHLEGQGNGTLPLSMVVMLINPPPPSPPYLSRISSLTQVFPITSIFSTEDDRGLLLSYHFHL